MEPNQLEGLQRVVFDVTTALLKPLLAFNQYDSFLNWPFVVCALLLAFAVYLVRRHSGYGSGGKSFFRQYFSRDVWGHISARADYKFYYVNGVLFPAIFTPLILSGAWLSQQVHGGLTAVLGDGPDHASGPWITVLYTLVFFLVYDFARYLAHFVQHRFDILWHFHKLHHSAEVLTPFTAFRAHPLDLLVMVTFPAAATGIVSGIFNYWSDSVADFYVYSGLHVLIYIYSLVGNLRHTHVWLSYGPIFNRVFISPAQHQIHHSIDQRHWGRNMGFALAFWDRLFGTLYVPKEQETFTIGLGDGSEGRYHGVVGMYLQPLRDLFGQKFDGDSLDDKINDKDGSPGEG